MVLVTMVVAVVRGRRLPSAIHRRLVIGHRLHYPVLRRGRWVHSYRLWVVGHGLRVIGSHWISSLRKTGRIVLAGDAGAYQTTSACAQDRAVAAADLFANDRTGHGANTCAKNRLEFIGMGQRRQTGEAASQERKSQNTRCVHGVVWA